MVFLHNPIVPKGDRIEKPVIFDYKNRLLHGKVFNADLPEMFSYSDTPQIEDKWVVPLGKSVEGIIWHDFDHTPQMIVAVQLDSEKP